MGDPEFADVKSRGSTGRCMWLVVIFLFLVAVALAVVLGLVAAGELEIGKSAEGKDGPAPTEEPSRPPPTKGPDGEEVDWTYKAQYGEYRFGTVSADNIDCSRIGTDIMAMGGSSVDVFIATQICGGVVGFESSGIGGGDFITIYDVANGETEKTVKAVDCRETAPAAATEDMFSGDDAPSSLLGGMAIAIPGELKGFDEIYKKYGKVPWRDLIMPSVKLARDGFRVSHAVAESIETTHSETPDFSNPVMANLKNLVYAKGMRLKEGDYIKRPKYADTLEYIAENGALSFYTGQLAEDIVADIADAGGVITMADLANYEANWVTPVNTTLVNKPLTIYGMPPPSSGAIVQYILNTMDVYDLTDDDISTFDKEVLTYHRMIEVYKFAYGQRSALGDAAYVDVSEIVANLTSRQFAQETRDLIDDFWTLDFEDYRPAFDLVPEGGTSHVSVVTPDGAAVAATCTVNWYFGSKVVGSRTGIMFNNEMDDFSVPGTVNTWGVPASESNYIVPGKRPMSSMSPTIALDAEGNVKMVAGANGGSRIITGITNTMIRALFLGQRLDEAAAAPRFHHQLLPHKVEISDRFSPKMLAALRDDCGHTLNVRHDDMFFANSQTILNNCPDCDPVDLECVDTCLTAAADYRKRGKPDGY